MNVPRKIRPVQLSAHPRGLTLLEVVLALGIFVGSLAAIGQLFTTGMQAAVKSRLQTSAIFRCESKMAEVVSGVELMQSTGETPFEDDENWLWSLSVETGAQADLLHLTVLVTHAGSSDLASTEFELVRYVRDPQLFLDASLELAGDEL
jgi:type II secretion system protein I